MLNVLRLSVIMQRVMAPQQGLALCKNVSQENFLLLPLVKLAIIFDSCGLCNKTFFTCNKASVFVTASKACVRSVIKDN